MRRWKLEAFLIAVLFLTCLFGGFFISSVYRKRTEQLEGFRDLISFTGAQIEGYLTPTHKIFAMFRNKALQKSGFLDDLQNRGWRNALDNCRGKLFLSERELDELGSFFSQLGTCDTESAIRHCNYYRQVFGELAVGARADLPSKTKLCRSLGFVIGVMLAVLFI